MENWEKIGDIILIILLSVIGIFMCITIAVLIDFYNDYQCSTTTSWEYWESHDCVRYCKECKNEKDNR